MRSNSRRHCRYHHCESPRLGCERCSTSLLLNIQNGPDGWVLKQLVRSSQQMPPNIDSGYLSCEYPLGERRERRLPDFLHSRHSFLHQRRRTIEAKVQRKNTYFFWRGTQRIMSRRLLDDSQKVQLPKLYPASPLWGIRYHSWSLSTLEQPILNLCRCWHRSVAMPERQP